ncbi:MAG TPA: CBS domain-containing protein [Acidimicrobiales bacterium]|nr:CBS domain-containing protein [Acidimicrobiales bacterium]
MKVEGILKAKGRAVETVPPDASVPLVLHKLSTLGIGALVVSGDDAEVLGTVSERDVVRALNRHGGRVLELRVSDVMSRGSPVCTPDQSLHDLMADMTRSRHRHVPVVEGGRLCGIVSIGDVVKHRLEEMELEVNVLRDRYIASR